jgi:quercetin dioxygenase-like cupin family protein
MVTLSPDELDFSDAWVEGDEAARWRSASGHGPSSGAQASGSSILEVQPGCKLPAHTDSAEETIVVLAGDADVQIDGETERVSAGGLALVPTNHLHEVRNPGEEVLRFAAVYADTDVVTTYREPVQPDGSRERRPLS